MIMKNIEKYFIRLTGLKAYLYSFGWPGTVLHESGHAIFCLIFGHKITDIKFFSPDYETGTLGYVNHSYDKRSIYQKTGNLFIGTGPVILGVLFLFLLFLFLFDINLLKTTDISISSADLKAKEMISGFFAYLLSGLKSVFNSLFNSEFQIWSYFVLFYLIFASGSSLSLSKPDIKTAFSGLAYFAIILFIFNLSTYWISDFATNWIIELSIFLSGFYFLMILTIILNFVFLILLTMG